MNKFFFVCVIGTAFNTLITILIFETVSWLNQLVVSLLLWMPRFNPWAVYIRFMVEKVALQCIFLWVFWFYFVSIILAALHSYLHLNVNNIRTTTSEWVLETFKLKGAISDIGELCTVGQSSTFTLLCDCLYCLSQPTLLRHKGCPCITKNCKLILWFPLAMTDITQHKTHTHILVKLACNQQTHGSGIKTYGSIEGCVGDTSVCCDR